MRFVLLSLDTSAGRLLVLEGIVRLVVVTDMRFVLLSLGRYLCW